MEISPDGTRLYVTTRDDRASGTGESIRVLDATTGSILVSTPILLPGVLELSSDGDTLYAVTNNSGIRAYNPVDLSFEVITTIPGGNTFDLALSSDGSILWSTNVNDQSVSAIDTVTKTILSTIPIGFSGHDSELTADGRFLLSAHSSSQSIAVIDTQTMSLVETKNIAPAKGQFIILGDESNPILPVTAYVGFVEELAVFNVDGTKLASIPLEEPYFMRESPDGRTLYVAHFANGADVSRLSAIDTQTNTVLASLDLASEAFVVGVEFSPDGNSLYLATDTVNVLNILNPVNLSSVSTVPLGSPLNAPPLGMTASADGTLLYVSIDGNLLELNSTTGATVSSFSVEDTGPIVINSDNSFAYGISEFGEQAYAFELSTEEYIELSPYTSVYRIIDIDISPDGQTVWVIDQVADLIRVYNAATAQQLTTLPLSGGIVGDFYPDSSIYYATNLFGSSSVAYDTQSFQAQSAANFTGLYTSGLNFVNVP